MFEDKGIFLRTYELESLLKSFFLFFLLLTTIYVLFALGTYRDKEEELKRQILSEMKIFSFRPTGEDFEVDFVPKDSSDDPAKLYQGVRGYYAVFPIPGSTEYRMKVILPKEMYQKRLEKIRNESFRGWLLYLLILGGISFLLAIYALYPLKKALELNEEFVKDILHDLNTPLSALQINLNLLKKKYGEERSIERMASSLETIQAFQSNLRAFLNRDSGKVERFDLRDLLRKRVEYFRQIYPQVTYQVEMESPVVLECNKEAMVRVLENLLSNAGRYNVPGGSVKIRMEGDRLLIKDTGIGIKHPERVFERFYKEGERGLGLGLHIVKKLSDLLGVSVTLQSREGEGTTVCLDLKRVRIK